MTSPIRLAYVEAAGAARALLASARVAERWHDRSALAGMDVAELARHLARHVVVVDRVLDEKTPRRADPVTAAQYYLTPIPSAPDPDAEDARALLEQVDATLASLRGRIGGEPPQRLVRAPGDVTMLLDEYLVTLIVELVVHADDLAVSVGETTPAFGPVTTACAIGCLLEVARARSGDLAVVRAMVRPGRDARPALPFALG